MTRTFLFTSPTGPAQSLDIPGTDVAVLVHPRGSPAHAAAEASLLDSGASIPLPHRAAWAEVRRDLESLAYVLRERRTGRYLDVFCADVWPSRMFPGYSILRVERFGNTGTEESLRAAVSSLLASVQRLPRILRLRVEVHTLDPERLGRVESILQAHGFARQDDPRNYTDTGLIDLTPPLEAIFADLHKTCRQNIRAVGKKSCEVRRVVDERLAVRIEELRRETYARSGGTPEPWDWAALIRFSAKHPALARISGLFRTDVAADDPASLLAFAWGVHHGDHGEVVAGGATRASGVKVPLAYGIYWDLIRWAKEHGATLYDMGGITGGTISDDDPVGGISDFKRYFNPRVQVVGSEYTMDGPRPVAQISRFLGRARELLPGR